MKALVIFSILTISSTSFGASLHVDDFGNGLLGWQGDGPMVVPTGGPDGENDAFMQVVSHGLGGPGSRAAAFNDVSEWTGDIATIGAGAIEFDMFVSPDSPSALDMRIVLFGAGSLDNRWTSSESQSVPNDGEWRHYSFSLDEAALTSVRGDATYGEMVTDVARVLFRHDSGTPSSRGTPVAATLGIDNIALVAVPEPSGLHLGMVVICGFLARSIKLR